MKLLTGTLIKEKVCTLLRIKPVSSIQVGKLSFIVL